MVKSLPLRINSVTNLELRFRFTKVLLSILEEAATVINVEGTWLDKTIPRKKLWFKAGCTSHVLMK
jgi:hypothetical protein